jgi:hypothetical protein
MKLERKRSKSNPKNMKGVVKAKKLPTNKQ